MVKKPQDLRTSIARAMMAPPVFCRLFSYWMRRRKAPLRILHAGGAFLFFSSHAELRFGNRKRCGWVRFK